MNKFHMLGTKHESYLKRFLKKYSKSDEITFNKTSEDNIMIFGDEKAIDSFSSKATFKQFFLVLLAFGFIREKASSYQVVRRVWKFENVTRSIFEISNDQQVDDYRNSRKICFLYMLNLLSKENIKKWNIVHKSSKRELQDISKVKKECSLWEKEATTSWENIEMVIRRIKNDYKIWNK